MFLTACTAITLAAAHPPSDLAGSIYPSEEALRHYAFGRLLEEQGAAPDALAEYFRTLMLDVGASSVARRVSEVAGASGEPERSLEFAEKALAMNPRDARALWLKGAALLNLGRDAEAIEPLEAATRIDSTQVDYYRTLARCAERLDRIPMVAEAYRRAVWLDDQDAESWFQLAAAEARLGRFGAADSALLQSIDLNPLRPGIFFLHGWIAENLGRNAQARELYAQHLKIHKDDQATRRRLVLLLLRDDLAAEAAREARIIGKAYPDDIDAAMLEAESSFRAKQKREAMQALDRLSRRHPDDFQALSIRVELQARNGRAKDAFREAEAWMAEHPDELRGRLLAARARDLGGEVEPALEHLRRAVAQSPDSIAARVMLARTLQSRKRLEEAEAVWTEAVADFPEVEGLIFDLATCREARGDLAGAEQAVRDVLARDPENPQALNFLGYLYADHDLKLDESVDLIQRALAIDPDNGAYIDSLGWAYYRLGRLVEAREQLERAVVLTRGDPVVHEHLGDVYKDMQLKDLAKEQYRRSLAGDSTNARVRAKLAELR